MLDYLRKIQHMKNTDMGAHVQEPAMEAVCEIARELDPEPEHVFHVRGLAMALFAATHSIHALGEREERLLESAALLHDTGYKVDAERHHKCSRDIILGLDLPGFSKRERAMIACIARYHRKGHPRPEHKIYRNLNTEEQALVRKLAAILRIADGLDRAHVAATHSLSVEREGRVIRIRVLQEPASPADLWGGLRKRGLFEEVFGVRIEINAAPAHLGQIERRTSEFSE